MNKEARTKSNKVIACYSNTVTANTATAMSVTICTARIKAPLLHTLVKTTQSSLMIGLCNIIGTVLQ